MDESIKTQERFFQCLSVVVSSSRSNEDKAVSALTVLHDLAINGEIRDFDWWKCNDINIYHALFSALFRSWCVASNRTLTLRQETLALLIWARISSNAEFDRRCYSNSTLVSFEFVDALLSRMSNIASLISSSESFSPNGLTAKQHVKLLQHLLLAIYENNLSLRSSIRRGLLRHAHEVLGSKLQQLSALDGGDSRDHVQYCLQILHAIIHGMTAITIPIVQHSPESKSLSKDVSERECQVITEEGEDDEETNAIETLDATRMMADSKTVDEKLVDGNASDYLDEVLRIRKDLLLEGLFPLHKPNEMVIWRDQIPIIQSYHEELVKCIVLLCERTTPVVVCGQDQLSCVADQKQLSKTIGACDSEIDGKRYLRESQSLWVQAIQRLLSMWPEAFDTNTPKQVLLLHELELLLERCSINEFAHVQDAVLDRLVKCVGTNADNIRPAQRALEFFKKPSVVDLLCNSSPTLIKSISMAEESMRCLLPAMFRNGVLSWNPTVNKMTALAMKSMYSRNTNTFTRVCNELFGSDSLREVSSAVKKAGFVRPTVPMSLSGLRGSKRTDAPVSTDSLPSDSRDAKNESATVSTSRLPPPSGMHSSQPPIGISKYTSTLPESKGPINISKHSLIRGYDKGSTPPVTVTGVAPWAVGAASPVVDLSSQDFSSDSKMNRNSNTSVAKSASAASTPQVSGIDQVMDYMKKCYEFIFESGIGENSVAEYVQNSVSEKPMRLPSLKFHDLVFGKDLGEGAFSVVKYARQITKGKPQTLWPEYAVKVVDAQKVKTHNYATSVVREISLLQILEHPNICRLLSAFRFGNSAYLVLEYASKGDLHSCLLRTGKLTHRMIRFVLGEIASAISTMHDLGFCYNDLKPENVLITELGHIKITDFGACRPYTSESSAQLMTQCEHIIDMRNGNWKEEEKSSNYDESSNRDVKQLFSAAGIRQALQSRNDSCEGTPAYMPPEAFSSHAIDTFAGQGDDPKTDAWGLGCIAYFCLHGKPRFFGSPAEVREQMETWFVQRQSTTKNVSFLQDALECSKISVLEDLSCEQLIEQLLEKNAHRRLSVAQVLDHPYITQGFVSEFQQVFLRAEKEDQQALPIVYAARGLYGLPASQISWPTEFETGTDMSGGENWARRQFSTLWAPMPKSYDIHDGTSSTPGVHNTDANLLRSMGDTGLQELLQKPLNKVRELEDEMRSPFVIIAITSDSQNK